MLTKVPIVKAMVFSVVMYGCESWTIQKAECQRTDAFKLWCWRRLFLDCKIKPINPKGKKPWIFIGRTDAEAEAPVLWPPDVKSWLIGKDPDAGKDRRQVEKGMTEDEMVGWHHWLSGHEFEQTLGDGEGQGSLECCSPWCCKDSDMTELLNNNNNNGHRPTTTIHLLCPNLLCVFHIFIKLTVVTSLVCYFVKK